MRFEQIFKQIKGQKKGQTNTCYARPDKGLPRGMVIFFLSSGQTGVSRIFFLIKRSLDSTSLSFILSLGRSAEQATPISHIELKHSKIMLPWVLVLDEDDACMHIVLSSSISWRLKSFTISSTRWDKAILTKLRTFNFPVNIWVPM